MPVDRGKLTCTVKWRRLEPGPKPPKLESSKTASKNRNYCPNVRTTLFFLFRVRTSSSFPQSSTSITFTYLGLCESPNLAEVL